MSLVSNMGPMFEYEWMCFDVIPLHLSVDLQKWAANNFSSLFKMFPCGEGSRFTRKNNIQNRFNVVMALP